MSEGWLEGIQGGNVFHGFMMGATNSLGGNFIDNNLESLGKAGEITANAILSGTIDQIGGGKFANGAITGAFSIMFNDMMHKKDTKDQLQVNCEEDNNDADQLASALAIAGTLLISDDATAVGVVDDPIAALLYLTAGTIYIFDNVPIIVQNIKDKYTMPAAEHTKNKRSSTKDKHTNPRPGVQTGKNRNAQRGDKNRKREHPINPNKRKKK